MTRAAIRPAPTLSPDRARAAQRDQAISPVLDGDRGLAGGWTHDRLKGTPRALLVAEGLFRRNGAAALDVATTRRERAIRTGRIAQADLLLAVCTILGDRDRVFSRLRRL